LGSDGAGHGRSFEIARFFAALNNQEIWTLT
jgi:hypothetical protein